MTLVIAAPYPADAAPDDGYAVVRAHPPHSLPFEVSNEQLVAAARDHVNEWEQFATMLEDLITAGWDVQSSGGVYATRRVRAAEVVHVVEPVMGRGICVEWCTIDADGGLFPVGGIVSRCEPPAEIFTGGPLPALIENALTGAQRVVEDAVELRAAFRSELEASATWWREHPAELSDHAAHSLPGELDELADRLSDAPVPASVMQEPHPAMMFDGAPRTHVHALPVSAIVFAGLMEACRNYSLLTLAPREGLSQELRSRGAELAAGLGIAGS